MTFTVTVRDHMMIAHSLSGEVFGPAQNLHGATYVVDASFRAEELSPDGVVVDIGRAASALHEITVSLTNRNLDDDPRFSGVNSTTERICRVVADALAERVADGGLGEEGRMLTAITVTLHESHIAWASFERRL